MKAPVLVIFLGYGRASMLPMRSVVRVDTLGPMMQDGVRLIRRSGVRARDRPGLFFAARDGTPNE